jgi:hypothetical protein
MADPGLRRLALNQATIPAWQLDTAIEACARVGLGGIGIWRDKLQQLGLAATKQALRANGLFVASLCKSAPLSEPEGATRRQHMDDNRRALDEAAEIGAGCLVMVVGGLAPGSGSRDIAGAARPGQGRPGGTATARTRPAVCGSVWSRCTRCMPPTAPASTRWRRPMIFATPSAPTPPSSRTSTTAGGIRAFEPLNCGAPERSA